MSWVCDSCSTVNEDGLRECFVCGEARSRASMREAKRRAREEKRRAREARLEKIYSSAYKWLMIIARSLFVLSTATFVVVFLVSVILKLTNGRVDDFATAIIGMGESALENLKIAFGYNTISIGRRLSHSAILDIPSNFKRIFLEVGYSIRVWTGNNVKSIWLEASSNIVDWSRSIGFFFGEKVRNASGALVSLFSVLGDKFVAAYRYWAELFSQLFACAAASCVGIKEKVETIIKRIRRKFSS